MPSVGRSHFDTYTAQNRVKHAILSKYFGFYLKALSRAADAFHYIDAFAGPGGYAGDNAGSPLHALDLLGKQSKPYAASFVERDPELCERLRGAIHAAPAGKSQLEPAEVRNAEFTDCIDEILNRAAFRRFSRVATFAFVDPWGLKGLYVSDFAKILGKSFGECLALLNYDGLNRWLGGVRAGSHSRDELDRFFGSRDAADSALATVADPENSSPHESQLLDIYLRAVRERSRATFILPFRFRAAGRERTSHYLIHLAQHPLAFRIMKEVMRGESASMEDYGSFGFIPRDEFRQGSLFNTNTDNAKAEIVAALRGAPQPVKLFTQRWVERPSDMFVEKEYRGLLLELERASAIEVLDARMREPVPAETRRKRAGLPTLSDRYWVRLKT
jgi:three-Cys-motif partner protein